jgi:hypothetical protein
MMKIGMIWFDNDPKTELETKISQAVKFYVDKYGRQPDCITVHPSMVNGQAAKIPGVELRTNTKILPNHIWVGCKEEDQPAD